MPVQLDWEEGLETFTPWTRRALETVFGNWRRGILSLGRLSRGLLMKSISRRPPALRMPYLCPG